MKRRIGFVGSCIAFWLSGALLSPIAAQDNPKDVAKSTFLVIYRPGPGWVKGKTLSEQPLKDHGNYMLSLYTNGSLKLAGPLADDAGGALVLEVRSEAEARAIVAADPAVKSGIFSHEMHPWALVQWDKLVKK